MSLVVSGKCTKESTSSHVHNGTRLTSVSCIQHDVAISEPYLELSCSANYGEVEVMIKTSMALTSSAVVVFVATILDFHAAPLCR